MRVLFEMQVPYRAEHVVRIAHIHKYVRIGTQVRPLMYFTIVLLRVTFRWSLDICTR